ncbi:hypothetical protein C435_03423 [Haloarcula marismortui ATCC 33799]|uniref:Uncharacterized protein n=1 Tax=Haloarcula marismortui ATCC 33799 TaxID=662475 RepID=M0KUK8_9EURY|nr:hypothetical protein C435_03423 [Haloarcula californiae ATCC 33799]
MSKNHSPHNSDPVIDIGFLAKQINSAKLGVDENGYQHHYWRGADAVVVYNEDGVDHVEYLSGRLLSNWVKYVEEERGWDREGTFAKPLIEADRWRKTWAKQHQRPQRRYQTGICERSPKR